MEKMYRIEYRTLVIGRKYRWVSLYNGIKGDWTVNKEEAIVEGDAHQRIITQLFKPREGKGYV